MKLRQIFAFLLIAVAFGACVTQTDFDAYKQRIYAEGESLQVWMEAAQEWFQWLDDNVDVWCPDCDPPGVPPPPPPPGDWM